MFNFIDFAAVIVFLVTMFDDSTQLVTVPRSSDGRRLRAIGRAAQAHNGLAGKQGRVPFRGTVYCLRCWSLCRTDGAASEQE